MPKRGGGQKKARLNQWRAGSSRATAPPDQQLVIEQQAEQIRALSAVIAGSLPTLHTNESTYDMQIDGDKDALITDLWRGDYTQMVGALRRENPLLTVMLSGVVENTYRPSEERQAHHQFKQGLQLEGLLVSMARIQNIHKIPFSTAAYSILAERDSVPRHFSVPLSALHRGTLMGSTWRDDFLPLCVKARAQQIQVPTIPGVEGCMFDNFSMKTNYGAYDRAGGGQGAKLDMTNWARMAIPASLAPAGFDAKAILLAGIFNVLSMSNFRNLFRLNHPEIVANKEARWVFFMRACDSGTMFSRPNYVATWRAIFTFFEPMEDVLQSKTEDVKFEINTMRRIIEKIWPDTMFLWVGGDGLSIMRLNHIFANDDSYFSMSPVCIPMLGEAPHGIFHVLHSGWRMYSSFIEEACSNQLKNPMYVKDPCVKEFNHSRYLLFILVRACSEYCLTIARDPLATSIEDFKGFTRAAERNIDFAWVVHFLSDAGFLTLQFQQSVRSNDSTTLDLLWREFYGLSHNARANKTNYCPMAIMRIYWSMCLVEPLAELQRRIRCLPTGDRPGTCTGWDCPIESLNGSIRAHVLSHISMVVVTAYVLAFSFIQHVSASLCLALCTGMYRAWMSEPSPRDTEADVALLLAWLLKTVGADWATATRANPHNSLSVPAVCVDRSRPPWLLQRDVMTSQAASRSYWLAVQEYVERLAPWQVWR